MRAAADRYTETGSLEWRQTRASAMTAGSSVRADGISKCRWANRRRRSPSSKTAAAIPYAGPSSRAAKSAAIRFQCRRWNSRSAAPASRS